MLVVCANCGLASPPDPDDDAPDCPGRGAALRVLEPMVLHCGWCASSNRRDRVDHCVSCGGQLPPLPGNEPGPRPVPAPRRLPDGYWLRTMLTGNVLVTDALEKGVPTVGIVDRVEVDYSTTSNRDHHHAQRSRGDRLWVVYVAGDPARHALWPPVY